MSAPDLPMTRGNSAYESRGRVFSMQLAMLFFQPIGLIVVIPAPRKWLFLTTQEVAMNVSRSIGAAGVSLVFASVLLTGCSSSSGSSDTPSGNTTCKAFTAQNSSDQTSTITSFLKDLKSKDPSNKEVTAMTTGVKLFCGTTGNDGKIKDIVED